MTRQFTTAAPPTHRSGEMIVTVPWRKPELACTCPAWCHRMIVLRGFAVIANATNEIVALATDTKAAEAAVRLLSGALALVLLVAGCASPARAVKSTPAPVTTELRFVSCMDTPPPFDAIDWPTPDSVGNVLMHASTVERVQNAYAELRRYALENYFRCLRVAEELGEQTATVEVEP